MIWIVVIFIFVVVFGYFKLPKKIKDFIGFIGLVSAPNFHLSDWLFTIIFILVTLTLIIYSLRLSSHKDEYETNAIKLLTEEFNRKYPEEDD